MKKREEAKKAKATSRARRDEYDVLDAICQFADEQAAVSGIDDANR